MSLLFVRNPDIYIMAFPNWRRWNEPGMEFCTYSNMFKESADIIIDSIGDNIGHIADGVINPALFMYRHSTELMLKAILAICYLIDGTNIDKIKDKLNGHSLQSLWDKADQ